LTASGLNCVIWCLLSSPISFYVYTLSSERLTRIYFSRQSLRARERARQEMGREEDEGNE